MAESPNAMFNLCVLEGGSYKDLEATVAFKAVRGKNDQGGGFVWRYRDANNYYIARMNPLEENYRVYKVVAGKRTQLATVENIPKSPGWHTIGVKHAGKEIICTLDEKHRLSVTDDTFTKPGLVGLWTKADARTHFDKFEAAQLKK